MLKIKIAEIFRHRNETTFRPYINARNIFKDVGIEFVFEGNDYDLTWVGQASFSDKNHPIERSISRGLWFLENKVEGDYVLFDGNDSASLMGTWDVFKESNAKLMLKNTLYSNNEHYESPSPHGRRYWATKPSNNDYSITPKDLKSKRFKKIELSGCNWLSTITPQWFKYDSNKPIDVCALFSYPAKENKEFQVETNQYYDAHRKNCIDELKKLPPSIKVAMLEGGKKIPIEQYYDLMSKSKIIIAPFGYGEIAPRDIEAAQFGAILIKPDMSHIQTIPNVYNDPKNYQTVNWNFSNLNSIIENLLCDFKNYQEYYVENMRRSFNSNYKSENLIIHTHRWLSTLDGYEIEM